MTLLEVADILDQAHRRGALIDRPEGVRTVELSDTLCRQMAEAIREAAKGGA